MLEHFFQIGPVPLNPMTGFYDYRLVLVSYFIATFASYIALDFAGRLRDVDTNPLSMRLWIAGGAVAMGGGIWSMHFIGMLAFTMPNMNMAFELNWTLLSFFVAVMASALALILLSYQEINWARLGAGGVILGFAIASMHYLGMQAMSDTVVIHYKVGLFIVSLMIAVGASEAALWFALHSNTVAINIRFRIKMLSALIMGVAICGMHYMGMAAAVFTALPDVHAMQMDLQPEILAITIAIVTVVLLTIALFTSAYKEAQNQQMLEHARHTGMAEMAVSVLHNVGNVLNSVNVSANLVNERILHSRLDLLAKLDILLDEHKGDLGNFITHDTKGREIPKFVRSLNEYWGAEKINLVDEINSLLKNLQHIRDIINVQQNISKKIGLEQIITLDSTLDEALFISGIEDNQFHIEVLKNYRKVGSLKLDKVKLLQIFVNLLQNAKDALVASDQGKRQLQLQTSIKNNRVFIDVIDNGVGINPATLNQIFVYGFTTKSTGHGFGLHASGLAAREMGGTLHVVSEGIGKGAMFTLELPYVVPKL